MANAKGTPTANRSGGGSHRVYRKCWAIVGDISGFFFFLNEARRRFAFSMKCRLPTRSSRSLCRSKGPRTRSGPSGHWTNVEIGSGESPLAGPLISHLAWGVPRCPSWLRELSEACDEMCIQGEQASKGSHSRTFKNIQPPGLASQTTKVLVPPQP